LKTKTKITLTIINMKAILLVLVLGICNVLAVDWEAYKQKVIEEANLQIEKQGNRTFDAQSVSRNSPLNCNFANKYPEATSVHRLRPGDIQVIGAIGDSLTAANGAKASFITGLLTEERGISWAIGGEKDLSTVYTLPNYFRKFNPNLQGFSTGSGDYLSPNAKFNAARPGHTSWETLEQAKDLVNRLRSASNINFNNSWKVITFFIGGNDLCDFCADLIHSSADNFVGNIRSTLDYFHQNLPKTLVNMVVTLDVNGIDILDGITCRNMQKVFCDCVLQAGNKPALNKLVKEYQSKTIELVNSGRYDTRDDFTVVIQPLMQDMVPPKLTNGKADFSYFAPDCFHFSQKGHGAAALQLWNNMFQRVGQKSSKWDSIGKPALCPTDANPYIFTNQNSN
jgi:phospholipase B1